MNRAIKANARWALLGLAGAVVLAGCSSVALSNPPPTATPQPFDLVLLHTNDTVGYTEPCG